MIKLSRLNGDEFVLNCDIIETIEATPDTVISLVNGKKYIVSETIDEIVEKVLKYKGKIASGLTKEDTD
jgi:flagellar protein FlbD